MGRFCSLEVTLNDPLCLKFLGSKPRFLLRKGFFNGLFLSRKLIFFLVLLISRSRIQPVVMTILKTVCVSGVFLLGGFVSFVEAQDQKEGTAVIGGIYTGKDTVIAPQKPRVKRDYVVKQTFRQKVGNRSVTIQEVEPPAEEPKPEQNLSQDTQTERQVVPVKPEEYISPKFIVVTATVYGEGAKTRSKITLWHDNKKCVAISRADFRIMSGFTQFKANGRPYFILEHIVDANAPEQKSTANKFTTNRRIPSGGFAVTEIEDGDTQLREILQDLHKLYRVEEQNLRLAYEKRKQNGVRQKPPEPDKPVTIRFWKREMSKENAERRAK